MLHELLNSLHHFVVRSSSSSSKSGKSGDHHTDDDANINDDNSNVPLVSPNASLPVIPLPAVTRLDLSGSRKSAVCDNSLRCFHSVVTLNLCGNRGITDAGLQHLTALTALNLTRNRRITSDALARLESLTVLDLTQNTTVDDIRPLANRLRALSLSMASVHTTRITDTQLSCMTALQELDLCCNDTITDHGIAGLTRLQWLSLLEQESVTGEGCDLSRIDVIELDVGLELNADGRIVELSWYDITRRGVNDLLGTGSYEEQPLCNPFLSALRCK